MNGPEHYRAAEQLCVRADEVLDADWGWMANLSTEERLARRAADLADAQVHATLAYAAATLPFCSHCKREVVDRADTLCDNCQGAADEQLSQAAENAGSPF